MVICQHLSSNTWSQTWVCTSFKVEQKAFSKEQLERTSLTMRKMAVVCADACNNQDEAFQNCNQAIFRRLRLIQHAAAAEQHILWPIYQHVQAPAMNSILHERRCKLLIGRVMTCSAEVRLVLKILRNIAWDRRHPSQLNINLCL